MLAWWILTNEGSKFKLDCLKFKNSYILMIDVINFKLRLINFVYFFFETRGICRGDRGEN